MKISLIQPSRNNLKYLKWSYESIRKNQGTHEVEICIADDFSDKDNTWEWCLEMMDKDPHFKAIRNEGPTRLGHTILYDRLVNEVASHDICMIYHADMYLCPGALDSIEKHLFIQTHNGDSPYLIPKEKTIVSLTRIEPPLHPPGPEKVFIDWGATEPEHFNEEQFLDWFSKLERKEPTEGIFAPWAFWKKDFQEIGGHDPLYAPQSKEDSDIFNRFQLNGVKFIQTWEGYVYHMTCRGSRFNPELTTPGKNSPEWEAQNMRSTRNFIRKWGHFCKHDALMKPIIPPKYNIAFIVKNCGGNILEALEPWCDRIYIENQEIVDIYIDREQSNTKFDLTKRVFTLTNNTPEWENDIVVKFDATQLNNNNFQIISQLSEIIQESGEVGDFEIDIFSIIISHLEEYQNDLIKL
jgi:glycosyltransferase involved in cell wall biosynthesis